MPKQSLLGIGSTALPITTVVKAIAEAIKDGAKPKLQEGHLTSKMSRQEATFLEIRGVVIGYREQPYLHYVIEDSSVKSTPIRTDGTRHYVRIHYKTRNHDIFLDE
jgi:hypothetical protein